MMDEKENGNLVPLKFLMKNATKKIVEAINDTQLDIHLKIEILQNILQLAIKTEEQECLKYEEQLKEKEAEDGNSKTE